MTTSFTNDAGTGQVIADGYTGPIGNVTPAAGAFSTLSSTGVNSQAVQIAAAAGSNSQTNSTLITAGVVMVTTVAATTRGVKLPVATTGMRVSIINTITTNMKIYPNTNGKIGAAATNANISLPSLAAKIFRAMNTTQWYVESTS